MSTLQQVVAARRIVIKVGSSSLTTTAGGLDGSRVDALVDALAETVPGAEIVLVSSGAIAAGLAPLGLTRRPKDLATQQAAASVGQGLLIARYTQSFARHGRRVGQVLLTADDVTRRSHYRNAVSTFNKLLELGGSASTLAEHGFDRFWRNVRTHTLHDPVRWKYHAIGNHALNAKRPPRHGAI